MTSTALTKLQMALGEACRKTIRPIIRQLRRRYGGGNTLKGRFSSWEEAVRHGTGYDEATILRRVEEAALKVKQGEAAFERDSVAFELMDWPFPLLAALLRSALTRQASLSVLDFGGSLGSTYQQCKVFLDGVQRLRWMVVEQPHYVRRGRELFQNEELQFFESIEAAVVAEQPDVIVFSGVLQYLERPYEALNLAGIVAREAVVIDRTPWAEVSEDIITMQIVPPQFFAARLPFRVFTQERLERAIGTAYRKVVSFKALDPDLYLGATHVKFGGWLFQRKDGHILHKT